MHCTAMAHKYGSDEQSGGLRVNPAYIEQGPVNPSIGQRRATHSSSNNSSAQRQYYRERDRRHTLGSQAPPTASLYANQRATVNEHKRELFLDYLKQKYPDHSESIEMAKSPDKDHLSFSNGFYDDDGTMSEMDTQATGFQRGGRVRASLPISRMEANKSKEKPLGLVYLNYMSETKRALMPNEVTGIDTVKALFVRAFPRALTMAMLDSPQRKIYIRDPVTEIFYELENLDEVKDRVILKIYEPGYVEESSTIIHNSTSTPIDLNVCSDSELADIELPDFRERNYNTVGSKPAGPGPDRFDPNMRRPNSTTPMEMSSRRMHPQQGRGGSGIPHRSPPPGNEPFQRGVPERSTAPVRQGPFSRSHKQRMSSTTLPRQQDGRRTPTNAPRSMTMPRPTDKGQVYRPHPENAGRPVEQRMQSTVQTTTMASGPGHDPSRHPPKEHQRDPNHPQHRQDFQPPRASTPQQGARSLERGMGPPRGPPQRPPDMREGPNGPRSGGGPPPQQGREAGYRDRSVESPRRQPPPQGPGSPVKAPRGEMRNEGPPYPRQQPPPDMQTRSPTRNAGPGMRQPPPNHMQQPGPNRPHDRTMERPRDRSMDRPRSTPPQRIEPRGHGPPPMKHPHPPQANIRDMDPRVVRQGPGSSVASSDPDASDRISVMEQQIASLAGMVRSALKPGEQLPPGAVPPQQRSPQRRPQQRPSSERVATPVQTPNRSKSELTGLNEEVIRATQNQKTFTRVDSFNSFNTGSDSQSVTPQPMAAISCRELRETTLNLKHTVKDLRDQLKQIRKLQLNMVQDMNVAFRATNRKVQLALRATPAGNEHPIRSLRTRTHQDYIKYQMNRDKLDKQIRDLESAVEEMRDDVVSRQCHVNLGEVDALAQAIGNSSKHIAEQKVAFPMLVDKMKTVMQGEMEIVVTEENFIKDEPGRLDDYMKRCKKVTGTLCTLKRLASVQEHRTPAVPVFEQTSQPVKREVHMDNIQKISADHKQRLRNIQAVEESRQRKSQPSSSQEARRFQMNLGRGRQDLKKTQNIDRINQRRRTSLKQLYMSEDHDALTPILTPEKIAKQATLGKKKVPPPPPPKRTHLSQQAVATHSSPTTPEGAVSASPLAQTPKVVVTISSESEEAPAIPPKPAMMVPKSQQQVDDPSSARSTPDLSCMSSSVSVNSECLSSPVKVPQSSCALSQSGFKSEPLLAIAENVQSSMINPQQEAPRSQKVRGPSTSHLPRQVVVPIPGTVMTSQSSPMRSNGGQAVPRSGPISPQGVTSPRGVVTPEGGVMLSQGAVMIAKSGSATSPGLATTPQRQAPVRLLSSSSQGSPSKINSPTSPQIKQSSIPVLKHNPNTRPGGHHVPQAKVNDKSDEGPFPAKSQTLPNSPPEISSAKRRSSVPSNIDIAPPPKPPRGYVDAPVEPTDSPPKSAFRPLAIPGWKETSLDEVPLKKKTSDKPRRHTVTLPQHQKRNGWVPSLGEHPANGSPRRHQPDSQSIPLLSPSKGRPVVTIEPNLAPLKMANLSKSQPGTDSLLNPEKKSTLQRQNSDPGSRPAIPIVDKKGAMKIQLLKEQYAKLRKLQEDQKMMDQQSKEKNPVQQPGSPQNTNQNQEGTSTDLKAKTLPSTTLEVDVSYSQGETSKSEDQDESSSYTKQTVIYRVGPKPFQIDGQKVGGSPEDIETATVVSSKREIIADSVPVSNGLVHQPVFSQLKSHEMAPRNFATKAKPVAVVNGNGFHAKTSPTSSTTPSKANIDIPAKNKDAVITNGGGKVPLTNGGTEKVEGQVVIKRTEKDVDKRNAMNVSQNEKAESKTVYTKRLEETFIF